MIDLIPPEIVHRRLSAAFAELGLVACAEQSSLHGFSFNLPTERYPVQVQYQAGMRFALLFLRLEYPADQANVILDELAWCAECCYQLGCLFHPRLSPEVVGLELGIALYISSLQYYALEEMLYMLQSCYDQIASRLEAAI